MKWIQFNTQKPSDDGMHLIYAPSADPQRPFIATAWWSEPNQQWEMLIDYWANAVTHWMPLPTPPAASAPQGIPAAANQTPASAASEGASPSV
jgi:hypothetical protein